MKQSTVDRPALICQTQIDMIPNPITTHWMPESRLAIHSGQTMLFIGDSLTDAGRGGVAPPLGQGFVQFFNALVTIRHPGMTVRLINRGVGGNTAEDLRSRWQDDVLAWQPDWLCLMIGINDANRYLCEGPPRRDLYSPASYREFLDQLLTLTRSARPDLRIVLIPPLYFSEDRIPGSYRARVAALIPEYQSVIGELAAKHQTILIEAPAVYKRLLKDRPVEDFSTDMVHLAPAGALLLAELIYAACQAV